MKVLICPKCGMKYGEEMNILFCSNDGIALVDLTESNFVMEGKTIIDQPVKRLLHD